MMNIYDIYNISKQIQQISIIFPDDRGVYLESSSGTVHSRIFPARQECTVPSQQDSRVTQQARYQGL
jgi:hypothetical protein